MARLSNRWNFSDRALQDFVVTILGILNGNLDSDNVPGVAGVSTANVAYIGDSNTDGSWRFIITGNDLVVSRRESNVWTEKSRHTA